MPFHAHKSRSILLALAAVATALGGARAEESTVCVRCTAPDASYACQVDGWSLAPDDARFRLYCISELAKLGKHASCGAERVTEAPCLGAPKILASPAGGGTPGLDLGAGAPAGDAAPVDAAQPAELQRDSAPDTKAAEQSAGAGSALGNAAKSAGEAVGNVGKAIGTTAKKSWDCVTSLFGDC